MMKDRLFLLENEFADADLPGRRFYCRDCITLNGLLAAFPDRAAGLEVIRIPHRRPREAVPLGLEPHVRRRLLFGGNACLRHDLAETRAGGFKLVYEELPFEWSYGRAFSIRRLMRLVTGSMLRKVSPRARGTPSESRPPRTSTRVSSQGTL